MESLNREELFLIALQLDFLSLLNFSCCNKKINELICKYYDSRNIEISLCEIFKDDIWYWKLNQEYPTYKQTLKKELSPRDIYLYKFLCIPDAYY